MIERQNGSMQIAGQLKSPLLLYKEYIMKQIWIKILKVCVRSVVGQLLKNDVVIKVFFISILTLILIFTEAFDTRSSSANDLLS